MNETKIPKEYAEILNRVRKEFDLEPVELGSGAGEIKVEDSGMVTFKLELHCYSKERDTVDIAGYSQATRKSIHRRVFLDAHRYSDKSVDTDGLVSKVIMRIKEVQEMLAKGVQLEQATKVKEDSEMKALQEKFGALGIRKAQFKSIKTYCLEYKNFEIKISKYNEVIQEIRVEGQGKGMKLTTALVSKLAEAFNLESEIGRMNKVREAMVGRKI